MCFLSLSLSLSLVLSQTALKHSHFLSLTLSQLIFSLTLFISSSSLFLLFPFFPPQNSYTDTTPVISIDPGRYFVSLLSSANESDVVGECGLLYVGSNGSQILLAFSNQQNTNCSLVRKKGSEEEGENGSKKKCEREFDGRLCDRNKREKIGGMDRKKNIFEFLT